MGSWRRTTWVAICCVLPSAAILGAFQVWPLLYAAWVSLHRWGIRPGPFIGAANYAQALRAGPFWQSVEVTLWYVLGTVPLTLLLAYLIAELLNRKIPGRDFYRVLFFTPYIVSPVAAAAVWKWVFTSASPLVNGALIDRLGMSHLPNQTWLLQPRGVFLWLAQGLGMDLPRWAQGPSLALCCIMAVTIWTSLGFAVVVLLGGLSQVPTEVLEAAELDGATGWRLRRHIIWPLLSPVLFFLLIVFTIRAFQAFSQIYVLTGENNLLGTTSTLTYYIYETAFRGAGARGYGSAVAFLLFGIILLLTWLQFAVLGRRVHYGGGS